MKKRNQKRWPAILLCWMMMLTNISIPALAEETTETPSCEHSETVSLEEAGAAATCTADGSHIVIIVCADCGQELSRNAVTDTALGHDYIETARTEATYDSEGSVTYTCSRCEDSYKETLPKLERPSGPFEQTETVDGAKLTVKAAAGVFDADTRLNISKTGNSDFTGAAENALGIRAGERIIISHTVYSISGAEMNGSAQAKLENLKLTDLQQAYPVGTVFVYVLRHDANAQRAADQARRISAEVNLGGNSVSFDLSEPGLYDVVKVVRLPEGTEDTTPIPGEEPAEESAEEPIDEPKKELTGVPAEEPAEEPGEESAEEPAEESGEESVEEQAGLTEESEPETEAEPLAVTISVFYEGELRYGSTVTLTAVLSVDDPEAVVTWEYSPDGGHTVFAVEDEYGSTLTYTYSEDTRNYSWRSVVNRTPAD